ncbi:MAG: hypothetical protein QXD02_05070, partial [Candidatus Parvarchaeum sp.]|nr:hypothetical protein [Candidatus Parvarchaeum tengchongense]
MVYKKNSLENRLLLNAIDNVAPNKKRLLNEVFQLNSDCKENHDPFFIDNLEKFVYNLKGSISSETSYKIEETVENLEFIYNLKELKKDYKFGNLPEKGEEENIAELYKLIADNCEILNYKQLSAAASLVHYLSTSDEWEKVNYLHL